MKKYYSILLIIAALSCQKNRDVASNACIKFIDNNPPVQLVSNKELDTIEYLMAKYKIDYSNLQFWQYYTGGYIQINSYQYVNNLKLFTNGITFILTKTDSTMREYGERVKSIDATNQPMLNIKEVTSIFFDKIEKDEILKNGGWPIDSCLDIEFGYYNLNPQNRELPKNFITAWKVTWQNKNCPQAIINDSNGEIIDYFNGIYFK